MFVSGKKGKRNGNEEGRAGWMTNSEAVIAHFERFVGKATFVPAAPRRLLIDPDVYAIAPSGGRAHWVLFTVGTSCASLDRVDREELPRYVELLMCLPGDWSPDESYPPHVLRYTARRVQAQEWPVDGLVVFPSCTREPDSGSVFGLLIAPSRLIGEHARIARSHGEETVVFGTYPVTYRQFERYREEGVDVGGVPEVIGGWREMMR